VSDLPPQTYGDSFAGVYDEWYPDADSDRIVAGVLRHAPGPRLLELGVGTGRIALRLAEAGFSVTGLDASLPMLSRLRAKPGAEHLRLVAADMAGLPFGREVFDVVLVATNTFCNIGSAERQQRCLDQVAAALAPGAVLISETFVPGEDPSGARGDLTVKSVELDRVVLTATWRNPDDQTVMGQHIELTEAGGVQLRPWHLRYVHPVQLVEMGRRAGLDCVGASADWDDTAFADDSSNFIARFTPS